ncbi:MAG: tetrathionate reductase family octaheme c-type cytochrome [Deltaproteobacteria bacterium]|nr:tetrathionate reductase family octaheme c-type cytochrome [Deltaproteobacteria bacterium]
MHSRSKLLFFSLASLALLTLGAGCPAEKSACDPACDANACMVCDESGESAACVSTCGEGTTCEAGACVADAPVTCDPACGPCQTCDTSGAAPACVDNCGPGLVCNAGACEVTACDPACGPCQTCDTSGAAPVCTDNCAAGVACNAGVCESPACDPACGPCQFCDASGAAPVCIDLCGPNETCDTGVCSQMNFHQGFTALAGPFADGPAVTTACLGCHPQAGTDMLQTAHWKWEGSTPALQGHENDTTVGKKNLINNFCVSIVANEKRCSQCHAGYGYDSPSFDFGNQNNIDCLVCHSDPGVGYTKEPKTAGLPPPAYDLAIAARSVGRPERANCGKCHFSAGGGDNVKKGDIGSALAAPTVDTDFHMGNGMDCANCHAGPNHTLTGQGVHLPVSEGRLACEDCHGGTPHASAATNNHALDIACQTCHVPAFSRQQPTKMDWNWSTAGNRTRGTDGVETTTLSDGTVVKSYDYMKGDFVWEKNVRPAYRWYDGRTTRMTLADSYPAGDGVSAAQPVTLGEPLATFADAGAKIFPFKRMVGQQPAFTATRLVAAPKLFGPGGFWATIPDAASYDPATVEANWTAALQAGGIAAGQLAAGTVLTASDWEWIHTELYLGINHEVAPRTAALGCSDCHNGNADFDFAALGYSCDPMTGGAVACGSRNP